MNRSLYTMAFGALQIVEGLVRICSLGFCRDVRMCIWLARRDAMSRIGKKKRENEKLKETSDAGY